MLMIFFKDDIRKAIQLRKISVSPNLVFLLLLMFPVGGLFCQVEPAAYMRKLWNEFNATNDDSLKIEKLSRLAFFYNDYLDDHAHADSVSEQAIQIAEASHRSELLLLACNRYVESNDLDEYFKKSLGYALKAEQLSDITTNPEMAYLTSKNLASVYLAGYQYDKALEYNYRSLSIAGISENIVHKAESYLGIGKSLEGKNQQIEAFRNYITACSLAETENNDNLLLACYDRLSSFYNFNKLYNKATRYKLMQRELIKKKLPVDSVAFMWTEYELQVIDINSNNNRLNERKMLNVLDFAMRNSNQRLMNYEIGLYRTHLIEADKIGLLYDLYHKRYPGEWKKLATGNPGLYYRLKAFFCEDEHQPDSALCYFNKAEQILESDPNMILRSKFYNRFGQFLLRHGYKEKALAKFAKSYQMAGKASYFEYMVIASGQLESLYAATGDYKNAYTYSVLNKVLSDSINNLSKKDQILVMEIDHETRQREWLAKYEKQGTVRRHNLQYTGMTIGIFTVFVILIMLGSLKVSEWIIRMLGFFSFIFLFEFIILLADQEIHEITQGEPWKILLIKIFLIAFLLPLHHGIEKKVIIYLLNHKLLNITQFSLIRRFLEHAKKMSWKYIFSYKTGRPGDE